MHVVTLLEELQLRQRKCIRRSSLLEMLVSGLRRREQLIVKRQLLDVAVLVWDCRKDVLQRMHGLLKCVTIHALVGIFLKLIDAD